MIGSVFIQSRGQFSCFGEDPIKCISPVCGQQETGTSATQGGRASFQNVSPVFPGWESSIATVRHVGHRKDRRVSL